MKKKNHLGSSDGLEFRIRGRASELIAFFHSEEKLRAKAKKEGLKISEVSKADRKWRDRLKQEAAILEQRCTLNGISPVPAELQELSRLLKNGKKAATSLQKNHVLSSLAWEYDLNILDDAEINVVPFAADSLVEAGGLRPLLKSPASGKNDLRQSVRPWMSDEEFLKNWKEKREKLKKFQARPDYEETMCAARAALLSKDKK